jgi:hypothetical protein
MAILLSLYYAAKPRSDSGMWNAFHTAGLEAALAQQNGVSPEEFLAAVAQQSQAQQQGQGGAPEGANMGAQPGVT